MTALKEDRLLTAKEVAGLVGIAPSTLAAWRSRHVPDQPPFVRLNRRSVRYRESAVRQWIESRRATAAPV